MRRASVLLTLALALSASAAPAQTAAPYKILKTANSGGDGSFDYVFADVAARRLYIPRNGPAGHLSVFNLDTLAPLGGIDGLRAGGAAVDPTSHHGFSTSKPVTMWDATALKVIKTLDVDGNPDGILFDPFMERVWIFSHVAPYATIIDAKAGTVIGTLDLGGSPEQGVSDGAGTLYVNLTDKANIAVVDAKTMTVRAHYDMSAKASVGRGLALDVKHKILFAYYNLPTPNVVVVNAETGAIITQLPTGAGVDTAAFNPATLQAVSAEAAGSMTVIKENSPTSFAVEQTLPTLTGAKTVALDTKTGHLFTMSAQFEPAPPPAPDAPPMAPGRPAPRGPMVPGSFSILMVGK